MTDLKDTVFSPSFGNRPSRLVGRSELLDSIIAGLDEQPGSKGRATVLLGQRGSGKTVLLWELADRARKKGFVVANPTAVREGMTQRVVEKLAADGDSLVKRSRPKVSGGTVGALGFSAGVSLAVEDAPVLSVGGQLERVVKELSARGVGSLLLIDEVQANSPEMRTLVGTYQELVGERLNVALVLAGLPGAVSGVLNDRVLTFLNRARKMSLDPLRIGDVDAYYCNAFAECGLDVAAGIRRAAARATYGSPYLMQLIGHYLVSYANESGVADQEVLAEALKTAQVDFENDVCETTLAALSERDVSYLFAMAHVRENGECKTADVVRELGVSADYGQQYRRRLINAGVIRAVRHGVVAFDVPYLELYLRKCED